MATIASLLDIEDTKARVEFLVEPMSYPSYDDPNTWIIGYINDQDSPLYADLYTYLKTNTIPSNLSHNQKCNFLCQSSHYTLIVETMYQQGFDSTLLRCIEHDESQLALRELHEGICGSHSSGLSLAKKLMRMGYYWPTMESDSSKYAKRCKKCQMHGNLIHAPTQELHPNITICLFS